MLGMIRDGSSLITDAEGYIVDPSQWTEDFANEVARREGITLTSEHWEVIRFMRAWLEDRGVAPDARHVMKFLAGDREAGRGRLFELFPYGYVKQACKIAGMKKSHVRGAPDKQLSTVGLPMYCHVPEVLHTYIVPSSNNPLRSRPRYNFRKGWGFLFF
jgi:tRNA 2-thiouridine synthesizing protein E